jgi:hypothetical protein
MQPTQHGRPGSSALTISQVIVSGFGLVTGLAGAGLLLLLGAAGLFSESVDLASATSLFSMAWVSGLLALLALPSLVYSFRRARGAESGPPRGGRLRLASLLLLAWPLALALGDLVSRQGRLAWLLLPPLHLVAVGLPVWWLVELARRRLPVSSRQREWGVLNFSLLITTPVVIAAEILVIGVLVILFAAWVSSQPELVTQLEILAQRILNAPPDPEAILQFARPYLQNPLAIFSILAMLSGIVPLLEELLKPLALWALAGRRLTPAEGFAAGALCGGAFALLESLLSLSGPAQDGWAVLAIGRAGTALLHTTTTALVGWALANAWQTGAYSRLGLAYLLSCALHGLWNALSVAAGLGFLLENPPKNLAFIARLGQVAPFGLIVLVLLLFLLLWGGNRNLRKTDVPPGPAPATPASTHIA